MARATYLSLLALIACGETKRVNPPDTSDRDIVFFLHLDAQGRLSPAPEGPWRSNGWPKQWSIPEDEGLIVIAIDSEGLRARYPSFEEAEWKTLRIIAPPQDLSSCVEEGLLVDEQRIQVPLGAVSDAVRTWKLSNDDAQFDPEPTPAGLALEFEARVCSRGPSLSLRAFQSPSDPGAVLRRLQVGGVAAMAAIDSDTLVTFGTLGLARSRRGEVPDPELDVISLAEQFPAWVPNGQTNAGALLTREGADGAAELVTSWVVTGTDPSRGRLLIAAYALTPSGGFELLAVHLVVEDAPQPLSLKHVFADSRGGYVAVGNGLVVTATSARATPRLTTDPNLEARFILPGDSIGVRHIAMGPESVFEGDLFLGVADGGDVAYYREGDNNVLTGGLLPNAARSPVAGLKSGALLQRRAAGTWTQYGFGLPTEAMRCAGSATVCGRTQPNDTVHLIHGSQIFDGLFLATAYCTAFFFRPTKDSCAQSIAVDGHDLSTQALASAAAMVDFENHVFVTTADGRIYELELSPK